MLTRNFFRNKSKIVQEESAARVVLSDSGHALSNAGHDLGKAGLIFYELTSYTGILLEPHDNTPAENNGWRRVYRHFERDFTKISEAVTLIEAAIKFMKQTKRDVRGVQAYTKRIVAEAKQQNLSAQSKELADENDILNFSKGAESSVELNIQRCEAILAKIKVLRDENKTIPQHNSQNVSSLLAEMLDQFRDLYKWLEAASEASNKISGVIHSLGMKEVEAMHEESIRSQEQQAEHLEALWKSLSAAR